MTASGPVAVVAPLAMELAALARRRGAGRLPAAGGALRLPARAPGEPELLLAVTGDGAEVAGRHLVGLLERERPEVVVIVGVAGGLAPDLRIGALAVADELAAGAERLEPPDSPWQRRALALAGARRGRIVSAPEIVARADAKRALGRRWPDGRCLAVDLESFALARAARDRGAAVVVLRAISDPVDEDLPLDLEAFRDASGRLDRRAIARRALGRPRLGRALLSLRGRVRRCSGILAAAAEAVLAD